MILLNQDFDRNRFYKAHSNQLKLQRFGAWSRNAWSACEICSLFLQVRRRVKRVDICSGATHYQLCPFYVREQFGHSSMGSWRWWNCVYTQYCGNYWGNLQSYISNLERKLGIWECWIHLQNYYVSGKFVHRFLNEVNNLISSYQFHSF